MIIVTDEAAGAALEEVGQLQRAIDAEQVDLDHAGAMIVERLDAVITLYADSTTVYSALMGPFMDWAIRSVDVRFIVDQDSTPESRQFKVLFAQFSALHKKWQHLDPSENDWPVALRRPVITTSLGLTKWKEAHHGSCMSKGWCCEMRLVRRSGQKPVRHSYLFPLWHL